MKLQLPWRPRQACRAAESRGVRSRALLLAALNTRYYRPLLTSAGLGTPEAVASSGPLEDVLPTLPRTEAAALRRAPHAFRNREGEKTPSPELFFPLPPASRTAILMPGFRAGKAVRVFDRPSRRELARFRPQALAGTVVTLRRLAEGAEDRCAPVPRLDHSVIAFHGPCHAFLSDEARDLFWRVFQVPVFGQFIGFAGELLAWECEAHDGFHIETENAVFETADGESEPELLVTSLVNLRQPVLRLATGLTAAIERSQCGCGRTAWRLLGLRRLFVNAMMSSEPGEPRTWRNWQTHRI